MILIALGSNLPSEYGTSKDTLEAAIQQLPKYGLHVIALSCLYETVPVPVSDQPNYVNGVAEIASDKSAEEILEILHAIEYDFGRRRTVQNAARCVDLDLIDCRGEIHDGELILPHPRAAERGFVLYPLRDIAPNWVHPQNHRKVDDLIAELSEDQKSIEKSAITSCVSVV